MDYCSMYNAWNDYLSTCYILIIGLVEAFLSMIILFKQHLFPTNIILNIIKKLENKFMEMKIHIHYQQ